MLGEVHLFFWSFSVGYSLLRTCPPYVSSWIKARTEPVLLFHVSSALRLTARGYQVLKVL